MKAHPGASPRDTLARERFAEERIQAAARFSRKVKWLSFVANFAASGAVVMGADSGSAAMITGGVSTLFSFLPLLFPHPSENIDEQQALYRKRIYGPISSSPLLPAASQVSPWIDPSGKVTGSLLTLSWQLK